MNFEVYRTSLCKENTTISYRSLPFYELYTLLIFFGLD